MAKSGTTDGLRPNKLTRDNRYRIGILPPLLVPLFIVGITLICLLSFRKNIAIQAETRAQAVLLESISDQASTLEAILEGQYDLLDALAANVAALENLSREQLLNGMQAVVAGTDLVHLGIADQDGHAVLHDGKKVDVSGRDYFTEALAGERSLERIDNSRVSGTTRFLIATPLRMNGEIAGVVLGSYEEAAFRTMLISAVYDGEGYSYICDAAGDVVVASSSDRALVNSTNILEFLGKAQIGFGDTLATVAENLKTGSGGILDYTYGDQRRYGVYAPIGVNDWFMFNVLPAELVEADANRTMQSGTWLTLEVMTCALMVVGVIALRESRRLKQMQAEQEARLCTYVTDELTGLLNERGFVEYATTLLSDSTQRYYLVDCDVGRFIDFNLLYGEKAGDALLKSIACKLQTMVGVGELCARGFADRFFCLLAGEDDDTVLYRLRKLDDELNALFENRLFHMKYGVYPIVDKTLSAREIASRAKFAKLSNNADVQDNIHLYNAEMLNQQIVERRMLPHLESALENREFFVEYQPKYQIADRRPFGAEALVRWRTPDGSVYRPGDFIPMFERNACVAKLDFYVLERVCELLQRIMLRNVIPQPIAVNFSRVHLYDAGFIEKIDAIAQRHGIPARLIEVEITESVFVSDPNLIMNAVVDLQAKGYTVAMDDFGSGHSSLNVLKEISVDVIKLDKGFFDHVQGDVVHRGEEIIRHAVSMARDLQITTVAEGVETAEQAAFLADCRCDIGQGYYFAHPLPEQDYLKLVCKGELTDDSVGRIGALSKTKGKESGNHDEDAHQ